MACWKSLFKDFWTYHSDLAPFWCGTSTFHDPINSWWIKQYLSFCFFTFNIPFHSEMDYYGRKTDSHERYHENPIKSTLPLTPDWVVIKSLEEEWVFRKELRKRDFNCSHPGHKAQIWTWTKCITIFSGFNCGYSYFMTKVLGGLTKYRYHVFFRILAVWPYITFFSLAVPLY